MYPATDLFASFAKSYETRRETEMSLADYLEGCRDDPMMYATAAGAHARGDRRAGDGRHRAGRRGSAASS